MGLEIQRKMSHADNTCGQQLQTMLELSRALSGIQHHKLSPECSLMLFSLTKASTFLFFTAIVVSQHAIHFSRILVNYSIEINE